MNVWGVGLLLIIIFEYEVLEVAALLKLSPPWISVVRYVGDNYSIKCVGNGTKIWRNSSGHNLKDHPKKSIFTKIENDHSLSLIFASIHTDDKGFYECSLKSEIDTRKHVGFELIVIQPVTLVSSNKTERIILKEGEDVTLECNTKGEPPPIISWFFDNKLLSYNENVETSSWSIRPITPEDDGTYTCRAFQKILQTHDVELSFIIKVFQKPKSPTNRTTVYGFHNESRNLTCAVKAYPIAYFLWYKDDHVLDFKKNGMKVYNEENSSTLEILLDDANVLGSYECEAANSQGTWVQKIEYREADTPQTPRLCYYERNDTSATISVFVEPFPLVKFICKLMYTKFTWYKGEEKWRTAQVVYCTNNRVPGTNKIHCDIRNLQPLTKYAVRAAIKNQGGLGNFSNEIIFRTRSESSNSITVKCVKIIIWLCLVIISLLN